MSLKWLGDLVTASGAAHTLFITLSLIGMVLAAIIWVMELSGYTISRKGIVKNNIKWNATTIAIIAISAAVYIVGRPVQFQFVPGIGGFNPTLALAPVLSILFGLPGAIGVTFSMPIGDAISGSLTVGSLAGWLSHTYVTWLAYKMVRGADFKKISNVLSFYLWAIIIGPIIHAIIIPGFLDLTHVVPPAVAWAGVTTSILINHMVTAAVVSAILIPILYPIVKKRGLYWKDRYEADMELDDLEDSSVNL
jgi:energy-coupling factor transport system substrate-specific component